MTFHYRAASRLVHPPTGGHPGCFQGGCYEGCCKHSQAGFRVNASEPLRQRHRSASAGSHGKSAARSVESRRLPHAAAPRLFPPAAEGPFLLLTSSPALGVVSVLDLSLSNRCVVMSCCCLNRVLADQGHRASFRVRICQASSPVFVPISHPFLVQVVFCCAVGVVNTPETSPSSGFKPQQTCAAGPSGFHGSAVSAPPTAKQGLHHHLLGAWHEEHVRAHTVCAGRGLSKRLPNKCWLLSRSSAKPPSLAPVPLAGGPPQSWDCHLQGSCHVPRWAPSLDLKVCHHH